MVYLIIFILKILENALGTLRFILLTAGMHKLGALLQLIISTIWIGVTGFVIQGFTDDPFKVLAFIIGSTVGSIVGSYIENFLAMGDNLIMVINEKDISEYVRSINIGLTVIKTNGIESDKYIYYLITTRKKANLLIEFIKEVDSKALIISEATKIINGGFY